MRISLEVEKLQTDWPVFVSGVGQRGDYAKQETLEIKWKILSRKVGCIIKITIKKKKENLAASFSGHFLTPAHPALREMRKHRRL